MESDMKHSPAIIDSEGEEKRRVITGTRCNTIPAVYSGGDIDEAIYHVRTS